MDIPPYPHFSFSAALSWPVGRTTARSFMNISGSWTPCNIFGIAYVFGQLVRTEKSNFFGRPFLCRSRRDDAGSGCCFRDSKRTGLKREYSDQADRQHTLQGLHGFHGVHVLSYYVGLKMSSSPPVVVCTPPFFFATGDCRGFYKFPLHLYKGVFCEKFDTFEQKIFHKNEVDFLYMFTMVRMNIYKGLFLKFIIPHSILSVNASRVRTQKSLTAVAGGSEI
jgi:hypothetical protein